MLKDNGGESYETGGVEETMSNFETTQWSMVLAAGDADSPDSSAALESLCEIYWYPLYAYARRRGQSEEDARDLTQGFFTKLLEKNWVAAADRERGKFRTFMLTALKHYMSDEWDRQRALKRGGGNLPISLDFDTAEDGYKLEIPDDRTPEDVFEESWARTVMERARRRLRDEMLVPGKEKRFEIIAGVISGDGQDYPYKEIAEALTMSEAAVKVAVYRMRQRFGEIIRAEIADTVTEEDDVDVEVKHVLGLLSA